MWTQYATQGFPTRAQARATARAMAIRLAPTRPGLRWRHGPPVQKRTQDGRRYWSAPCYYTRDTRPDYHGPLPASWDAR